MILPKKIVNVAEEGGVAAAQSQQIQASESASQRQARLEKSGNTSRENSRLIL